MRDGSRPQGPGLLKEPASKTVRKALSPETGNPKID